MDRPKLYTRDEFREKVFARDKDTCVIPDCNEKAVDAHHIIERKLWDDEGYYLENGASVCEKHHRLAEKNIISPQVLRDCIGIKTIVLPKQFDKNTQYNKWGNTYTKAPRSSIKYPSTEYISNSPSADTSIDISLSKGLVGIPLLLTKKMDGSNVKIQRNLVAARNGWHADHKSFDMLKARHPSFAKHIPEHITIFGEWLYAKHSIEYDSLDDYLQLFAVYDNQKEMWLAWSEVERYSKLIGCKTVPVVKKITYDDYFKMIKDVANVGKEVIDNGGEGIVLRNIFPFHYSEFSKFVLKYVRANHVQTDEHWSNMILVKNKIIGG